MNPMKNIIEMPPRTYRAKLFEVRWENTSFRIAGTLDGYVDLAVPNGTYPLSVEEAENLAAALIGAIADVRANCLHDRDSLLLLDSRD